MFCLFKVTGVRINKLLPLKIFQLEALVQSHWVAINLSKRGPSSHKAFLTQEGQRLIKDQHQDFELTFSQPNITSHSFRIECIIQLWKDTKDIEFVRQTIGHVKIESRSKYVENLLEEERQKRMLLVKKPPDLIISSFDNDFI